MSYAPLYEALVGHLALGRSSFHTPGHKSNPAALPAGLLDLDLTELPDTDSLFEAAGPILQAEKLAARLFSAKRTLLSAGGCTLCIQAMLRLAMPCGGRLAVSRMLHRSAVNTMALLGIDPVWAMPNDLLRVIHTAQGLSAAYVTSPDYYGRLADIPALSQACRERGIPLLVDNAHGAHLAFVQPQLHPLSLGASITACSAHKTLNVLTGGAWLNIGDDRFVSGAKEAMALFGSTSPGYPVMASLDLARAWLEEYGKPAYAVLQERVFRTRQMAERLGLIGPEGPCDPTRITLWTAAAGLSGQEAAASLRENGIEPEYADSEFVVLIATPFNTEKDFLRLETALSRLPRKKPLAIRHWDPPAPPPTVLGLREAVLSPQEEVPLAQAVGRVAGQAACPCPPGIPVVVPGEKITASAAEFLHRYGFLTIKVIK